MQSINFETGVKEFSINGGESKVIRFYPNDYGIIERVKVAQKKIEELIVEYSKRDPEETIDKFDLAVRKEINFVFGSDVCSVAFGSVNSMTLCSGQPLCINFLEAVLPIIESTVNEERQKSEERIRKYTEQVKAEG